MEQNSIEYTLYITHSRKYTTACPYLETYQDNLFNHANAISVSLGMAGKDDKKDIINPNDNNKVNGIHKNEISSFHSKRQGRQHILSGNPLAHSPPNQDGLPYI